MSDYIMMIWDTENITTPALGDLFCVMSIETGVLKMDGSLGTHVELEPYVGDKQLAQCREELEQRTLSLQVLKTAFDHEVEERVSAQVELADACAAQDALTQERDEARRNLQCVLDKYAIGGLRDEMPQRHSELKDLQGANRALVQQVADMEENRDYWYEACLTAEDERIVCRRKAQKQSDEIQRDWLSPVETKGLRRQLAHTRSEREYWLRAHDETQRQLARMEILRDRCLRRTEALDDAEAALNECGIGGIYTEFNDVADAVAQMSEYIKEPICWPTEKGVIDNGST